MYVTGIALTYAALGLVASLTGKLFGAVSSYPLTYIAVGAVIIISGLAMLDVFTMVFPAFVRLPMPRRGGVWSSLLLGLMSGLIIGPCVTPPLSAILAYLATTRNIVYGASLLFVFAFGMGTLLIVAGTFGSLLVALPKSGRWMEFSKKIAGIVLLAMGGYFVYTGIRRM
jgi:thiol:disulfide interchange protein DsbD